MSINTLLSNVQRVKCKEKIEQVTLRKDEASRGLWKDKQQTMCLTDWVSKTRLNAKPIHSCTDTVTTVDPAGTM